MSILNICLSSTRALVCVDTKADYANVGASYASKAHVFCHASAVLAGLGSASFINGLHYQLGELPLCDFDAMIAAMPSVIDEIYPPFAQAAQIAGLTAERGAFRQVVAMVGWSHRLDHMHAVQWGQEAGDGFVETALDEAWYHNPPPEAQITPNLDLETYITRLAKLQTSKYLEKNPAMAIGGELVAFEIQRTSVRAQKVCRL